MNNHIIRQFKNLNKITKYVFSSAFVISISTICVTESSAQTRLEENAPELRQGRQITQLPGTESLDPAKASDKPLGTSLKGIKIIDNPRKVKNSIGDKGIVSEEDAVDLDKVLSPFLGKPLSLKLVVEIRVAITKAYREAGKALVAVIVPPQEVTTGSIQVLVAQFKLGQKRAEGQNWTPEDYILGNIHASSGEVIDSDKLVDDLNWLNLNPYRNLIAVLEPGKKFGETNLILRSNEKKPWTVYGGYNNHGTPSTQRGRIFAGFNLANLPFLDHQLSYKFTTSPDAFDRLDQDHGLQSQNAYQGHDGIYFVPLPWRHKLKMRAAYIETRSNLTSPLMNTNDTFLTSAEYMVPLPKLGSVRAELFAEGSYKRGERETFSNNTFVSKNTLEVLQGAVGVRGTQSDSLGRSSFDLRVVHSPGDVTNENKDANFTGYSGDPLDEAKYTYLYANLRRITPLGSGLTFNVELTGQYTKNSLPSTETFSIGGDSSVRGYRTFEASGDSGVMSRFELHIPAHNYLGSNRPNAIDYIDLYPFLDLGYVEDERTHNDDFLAGAGLGVNIGLMKHVTFNANIGMALDDGPETNKNELRGFFGITATY